MVNCIVIHRALEVLYGDALYNSTIYLLIYSTQCLASCFVPTACVVVDAVGGLLSDGITHQKCNREAMRAGVQVRPCVRVN